MVTAVDTWLTVFDLKLTTWMVELTMKDGTIDSVMFATKKQSMEVNVPEFIASSAMTGHEVSNARNRRSSTVQLSGQHVR